MHLAAARAATAGVSTTTSASAASAAAPEAEANKEAPPQAVLPNADQPRGLHMDANGGVLEPEPETETHPLEGSVLRSAQADSLATAYAQQREDSKKMQSQMETMNQIMVQNQSMMQMQMQQMQMMQAQNRQLEGKLEALEKKARKKSRDGDSSDEEADTRVFAPRYDDASASLVNPHRPAPPRDLGDKPRIFPLKEGACPVHDVLRKKKSQAYHEFGVLHPLCYYLFNLQSFLKETVTAISATATGEEVRREACEAIINTVDEVYAILLRRLNLVELRTRTQYSELESTEEDEALLSFLDEKIAGLRSGWGLDSAIDPVFKKYAKRFHEKSFNSRLTQRSKQTGEAAAKRDAARKKKWKPGDKKPGDKSE